MPSYKKEAQELRTQNELKRQANETLSRQLELAEEKLAECKEEKKKRYSAIVYCENCLEVSSVLIPPGVKIDEGDCTVCRVRNKLKIVKKVNT